MLEIIIFVVVVALDQVSKALAAELLTALPGGSFPLIDGVFHLTYVENVGAAFGMLKNARWFFIAATLIVCAVMIFVLIKEHKKLHGLMRAALALILAGAVGNLIDRVVLGYVRDMLHFALINFAVFNVADSALTVGTAILVLDVLFGKGRALLADKPKAAPAPDAVDSAGHDAANTEDEEKQD